MADSTIVFLVLAGVVVLFVSNRLPVEVVAFATAPTLWYLLGIPMGPGYPTKL